MYHATKLNKKMSNSFVSSGAEQKLSGPYAVDAAIRSYITYIKGNPDLGDALRYTKIINKIDSEEMRDMFYRRFPLVANCTLDDYIKARKIVHDPTSCMMMYPFVPRWKILADAAIHSFSRFRIDSGIFALAKISLSNDEIRLMSDEFQRITKKPMISVLATGYYKKKKLRRLTAKLLAMEREELSIYEDADLKKTALEIIEDDDTHISERFYQIFGTKSWDFLAAMIKYWDENLVEISKVPSAEFIRAKCEKHNEFIVRWLYRRAVFGSDSSILAEVIAKRGTSVMAINKNAIIACIFMARFYLPEIKCRVKDFKMIIGTVDSRTMIRVVDELCKETESMNLSNN